MKQVIKVVKKLSYESSGICIVFEENLTAPFFIDFNDFKPNTVVGRIEKQSYPGMDGATTFETSLDVCNINLSAKVLAHNMGTRVRSIDSVIDETKNLLAVCFNPKNIGVLRYVNNVGEFFIECRPTSIPAFGNIENDGVLPFQVDLYSDSSYWSRADKNEIILGGMENVLQIPTNLPVNMPKVIKLSETINNSSGLPAFPKIQLFPCASAPLIVNEISGKYLALNNGISDGFYVEIDTAPEKQTVNLMKLDDITGNYYMVDNVEYWLTADSNVDFEIVPGVNVIKINTTSAVPKVARLIWNEQVLAV